MEWILTIVIIIVFLISIEKLSNKFFKKDTKYTYNKEESINQIKKRVSNRIRAQKNLLAQKQKEWQEKYDEYMKSEMWQNLRMIIFNRDYCQCRQCHKELNKDNFHCHHITYERFKFEAVDDLVTLCPECHEKIHEFHGKDAKYYPLINKDLL